MTQETIKTTLLNCILNPPGSNSFFMLAYYGDETLFEETKLRITPIKDTDFMGRTILMYAVSNKENTIDYLRKVVELCDINTKDKLGHDAFFYAKTFGNVRSVLQLGGKNSVQCSAAEERKKELSIKPAIRNNAVSQSNDETSVDLRSTTYVSVAIVGVGIFSALYGAVLHYASQPGNHT
jgi:ankyrin repeat protein